MSDTPSFRCGYVEERTAGGRWRYAIRGRFEVRMPDPADPSRTRFGPGVWLHLDTGATETAVDESFAAAHGFGDFRHVGRRTQANSFNSSATSLPAWRLYRWVRFRDYRDGLHGRVGSGGIPHLEFRIAFVVVPGVTIPLPLFGVRDMHNYFTMGSRGNDYHFFARGSDGNWPPATDGGQGVREIP